ncbi:unnamed protein product [Ixodes pacificus]
MALLLFVRSSFTRFRCSQGCFFEQQGEACTSVITCACRRVGRNHSPKLPEQSSDGKRENVKQPCTAEVPDRSGLVHPVQEPQYFKSRTNQRYVHVSATSLRGMRRFSRILAFSSVARSQMAFFLFFLFNPSRYGP